MVTFSKANEASGRPIKWPYRVDYSVEKSISTDVLVIGGGIAGCFAAISAVRKGARVAVVDKGVIRQCGSTGAGIDHWHCALTNPASRISPDEYARGVLEYFAGWDCGIGRYIECMESYDALLELEKMGVKIRDSEDEFKGAPFRDENTKHLYSYDYENKNSIRIWGTSIKPSLQRECSRLGIEQHERTMITSLLTEKGRQGRRVVGATGFNMHTGEFYVFSARAVVMTTAAEGRLWMFSSEQRGLFNGRFPGYITGDGFAMAWNAGAEVSLFEKSVNYQWGSGGALLNTAQFATGYWTATWRPCNLVDSNGKEVPWADRDGNILTSFDQRNRPAPGQKFFIGGGGLVPQTPPPGGLLRKYRVPMLVPDLDKRIGDGEFVPPFYADLPAMPENERRAIFGLMVGQEGKTWIVYRNLVEGGFDPAKDLLQYYPISEQPRWRELGFNSGGLVYDWDLRTTLPGLYAAGETLMACLGAAAAAATGRYAGRKAGEYAVKSERVSIDAGQVQGEKERIYRPIRARSGIDWKELNIGICEVMQDYCGDTRNDTSLKIGLKHLDEIRHSEAATVVARNPHELARALECMNILTVGEMVMHASLARKASSAWLNFYRTDYPQVDPPEWNKFITLKLESGNVTNGEMPRDSWGDLRKNYLAHSGF